MTQSHGNVTRGKSRDTKSGDSSPVGRGRPRDPATDEAALEAARAILATEGYAGLTFHKVAERAGVTRPTLYTRWPSKIRLAYDAAFPSDDGALVIDTDDFVADVGRLMAAAAHSYSRPATRAALPVLLAEFQQDPSLQAELREPNESEVRARFAHIVEKAVAANRVTPDVQAHVLFDTIVGAIQFRAVFHQGVDLSFIDALRDLIFGGVLISHDPELPNDTGDVADRLPNFSP
ncbi:TetR/AcrR family transcriptional regulator [Gordonia rubripertincta]|uniref:TetR/AcrR family transcriptional regulator n=1 Tax=Gordonia rubripertincta TaxID=36822 RepID=A0ABT4MPM3_GORRU|nr:TetR/AcrR family transcriptional regulator [Gordonia rubripertincta]MCZ4548620.1 TetR/AcrR family transcriptional regulator [Gordonia rubripertincta]